MSTVKTAPLTAFDWDVRVRDRNLANGKLTDKSVANYLENLVDVAENSEPVSFEQPALTGED